MNSSMAKLLNHAKLWDVPISSSAYNIFKSKF